MNFFRKVSPAISIAVLLGGLCISIVLFILQKTIIIADNFTPTSVSLKQNGLGGLSPTSSLQKVKK